MTTPVNASVFLNVLKMCGNLGGKSDPSALPILLIKSREVFFSFKKKMYQEYWSWRDFFTLKMPSYLLMSSAGYLTAGFACFRCNIWQPSSTDSFNVKSIFFPDWAWGIPALTVLSLIKNSITSLHSLSIGLKVSVLLVRLNDVCFANRSAQFIL